MGCVSGSCKYGGRLLLAQKIGCGGMLTAAAFSFLSCRYRLVPPGPCPDCPPGIQSAWFPPGESLPTLPLLVTLLAGSNTVVPCPTRYRSPGGNRKFLGSPFVGAMKIARNLAVFGRLDEWHSPFPAPSLRELARPLGVTEGVSSDGCSGPTIYTPAHINSEIFELLRSSKYTPSVSHSLDSSLREGAGNGCGGLHHSSGCSLKSGGAGDFHRPYENSEELTFIIEGTYL